MTDDAQSLAERRGTVTYVHATLLCNLREQKIEQAMASSYIAPGALEGKNSQIYVLDLKDQMYIREDGTPMIKLHERYGSIFCTTTARAYGTLNRIPIRRVDRQVTRSSELWSINYNYGISL